MSTVDKDMKRSIEMGVQRVFTHAPASLVSGFVNVLTGKGQLDDKLLDRLLEAGIAPLDLYHLILRFRDEACLQLAPWNRSDVPEEQWMALQQLLNHYDRIYIRLLRAMDEHYRQELDRARDELVEEGQAYMLAQARNRWAHEKEITLYNHYKELPIMAQVDIYAVREHEIVTECNSALFPVIMAGEQGRSVRTRMPGKELAVQLIVEEGTRTHIHWRYAGAVEIAKEKRSEIRVQSSKPMDVVLIRGKEELLGAVRDISTQGLGLTLQGHVDLQPGELVGFSMMMHGWEMHGSAEVRWSRVTDEFTGAGLKLDYERMSNLRLQAEVVQRQKVIMGELRLHGVPDCLL